MLLAHRPNRSPFSHHQPPADRTPHSPALPFTLICRPRRLRRLLPGIPSLRIPRGLHPRRPPGAHRDLCRCRRVPFLRARLRQRRGPHHRHLCPRRAPPLDSRHRQPRRRNRPLVAGLAVPRSPLRPLHARRRPLPAVRHLSILTAHRSLPPGPSLPQRRPVFFAQELKFQASFCRVTANQPRGAHRCSQTRKEIPTWPIWSSSPTC